MTSLAISDLPSDEYARIFGARSGPSQGRSRLCTSCGDWHSLNRPWPHNCRPPASPKSALSSPMIAPTFGDFTTGGIDAEVVGDRRAKRNYMDRHELTDYEPIQAERPQTEREWEAEFAHDIKRAQEEDPLNRPPVDVIGRTDMDGAGEINMADVEIAT